MIGEGFGGCLVVVDIHDCRWFEEGEWCNTVMVLG